MAQLEHAKLGHAAMISERTIFSAIWPDHEGLMRNNHGDMVELDPLAQCSADLDRGVQAICAPAFDKLERLVVLNNQQYDKLRRFPLPGQHLTALQGVGPVDIDSVRADLTGWVRRSLQDCCLGVVSVLTPQHERGSHLIVAAPRTYIKRELYMLELHVWVDYIVIDPPVD